MQNLDGFTLFLEFVKYLIPSLVVFLVVHFLLKSFFDSELQKRRIEIRIEQNKVLTPLKLQAYERLVILMERMTPNNLIFRVTKPGISASQLKYELIQDITNEFNHNLSQQVYVSPQAWQIVRIAKEEMVNIINTAYTQLGPNSVGLDLSKAIFEHMIQMEQIPTYKALDFLRKEFHLIFD
ncbi:MAG: hypothetical protein ACK45I_04585 [Bacteroidota bacterium]|jgi:hypothetical protein